MKKSKRLMLCLLLAVMLPVLCACHENPSQELLYSKLLAHFEAYGFACRLENAEEEREVPIYNASAWNRLLADGEEVLVYFDDSNRADYLMTFVDEETFGRAWRFGLRFVLVYNGGHPGVIECLNAIEND